MRLNRLFSVAMLSIIFGGTASAQQPYGGCWHPEHVKNWSPETDKNAKFNRSKVPLAKRFKEPTLMKANKTSSMRDRYVMQPFFSLHVVLAHLRVLTTSWDTSQLTGSIWINSFIGQVLPARVLLFLHQHHLQMLLTRVV